MRKPEQTQKPVLGWDTVLPWPLLLSLALDLREKSPTYVTESLETQEFMVCRVWLPSDALCPCPVPLAEQQPLPGAH